MLKYFSNYFERQRKYQRLHFYAGENDIIPTGDMKNICRVIFIIFVFVIINQRTFADQPVPDEDAGKTLELSINSTPREYESKIPRALTIDAGTSFEIEAATLPSPRPSHLVRGVLTVGASTDFQNSLDDNAGHARATRESILAGLDVPVSQKTSASASIEREWSQYDFELNPSALADIGFMHLSITRFGLIGRHQINKDWMVIAVGDLTFSTENHAAWSDGMTYGGLVAARQQVNKSFAWQIGLVAHTRLEDSTMVLPIPGIDWKINDRLSLQTAQGMTLSYNPCKNSRWLFDFGANFENRIFRMDDRSALSNGIFIDRRIPLLLAATFRPSPRLFVKLSASVPVYRQYKFCADDGTTVDSFGSDITSSFNISAGAVF